MPVSTRKPAHRLLDQAEMGAEAREERGERLDRERRDDERHAEAERIDREHAGALGHRRLGRRNGEDRGEDRPDARRPAEREGKPHQISAPQADRLGDIEALLAHQPGDRRQPEKMQTHDDDGDAGDDGEFARIGAHHARRWRWRWRRARRTRSRSRARTAAPRTMVSPPHPRLRLRRRQTVRATCR